MAMIVEILLVSIRLHCLMVLSTALLLNVSEEKLQSMESIRGRP